MDSGKVKHNFFCKDIPRPANNESIALSSPESHHAIRVLRLEQGDAVGLLDGRGTIAKGRICAITGSSRHPGVKVEVIEHRQVCPPTPRIHLYAAPPRAKKMVDIVRQATELGIHRLIPVICRYNVAKPERCRTAPKQRWLQEATAALKQSGNPFMPEFTAPADFDDALAKAPAWGIFGDADAARRMPSEDKTLASAQDVGIWIGPEAGFHSDEKLALDRYGCIPVSAGPWTLRVETAVPALIGWLRGRGFA